MSVRPMCGSKPPESCVQQSCNLDAGGSQKIAHGSLAYYGTYTVTETEKSLAMQIEGATFPNWIGTSPKHLYAISGDTLTITNPTPSGGGGVLTVVLNHAGQKAM